MEKANTEDLMRRLCATAAVALQIAADDLFGESEWRAVRAAEHFERLAKGAVALDTKELEYVATFN